MKQLYHKTFDQVLVQQGPRPEQVERQRASLTSRCAPSEREATTMKQTTKRPARTLLAAAAAAAVLTISALAASGVLWRVPLFTGGWMESGTDPDGTGYASISGSTSQEKDPVSVREGRVWFTTDTGAEVDITGQFSETEPYVYTYTDGSGLTHDIVVGGTPEDHGCFEFLYDAQGDAIGASGSYPVSWEGWADPTWLTAYQASRGLRTPGGGAESSSSQPVWLGETLSVEDGRTLLTVGGETWDITGQFSETQAYVRSIPGTDGLDHVLLVGETPEGPQSADVALSPDGSWTCSTSAPEDSPWLTAYLQTLDAG
ncbi:MAG TPA: hypothetical protein H9701_09110 [Candidatus Intestinimonas pullistercoris]|uniref:Uncharacterized protein n=2 Tax=Intestinimonas TaxID=1392389 RepID=A0A9D2NZP9_9FIRM|nr:hypothetical protein [Candidatus Intestinimonas pullistercoris]